MSTVKHFSVIPVFFGKIVLILLVVLAANLIFNYLKADAIKQTNTTLRTGVLKGMLSEKEEDAANLGFLTNDFKLLETNRYDAEIEILIYLYTVILALSYALYLNWFLTIIFLIGSLIPTVVSSLFQKSIQNASRDWTEANDQYVNQTKNLLAGTATFSLYGKQENAIKQNKKMVGRLEEKLAKMNLLSSNTNAYLSAIAIIGTYSVPFAVGVILVIKGQTTLGALFAVTQLSNSFVNPILEILNERNNLSTTKEICAKVDKLVAKGENQKSAAAIKNFSQLQVEDISLSRQKQQLAQHIDLAVKQGQKVAVIGPSGAGKSTLLQFLMYGNYGQAKKILLDQKKCQPGSFTNLFSYSSQSPVIFADTLWFNLTLGEQISETRVSEVCAGVGLGQIIQEKGFAYQLGDNADQLSGGQLSRIELARSILANRPILLLDEVNASLDKATSNSIHDYLFNSDLTFLEVIHHYDPDELQKYDTIIDFNQYSGLAGKD